MLKELFWSSACAVGYVYAGYPVIASLLGSALCRPVRKDLKYQPSVTVLIAAYNEVECIGATVRNKLSLEYPPELLEVIVISDGSTDGTDEAVRAIAAGDPRVRLLRQEPRAGKTSALNQAVPEARGEIVVFSDANSIYESHALLRLVANFADLSVGYVTGKMVYTNPGDTANGDGCSAYMRYENRLREIETMIGSVVGVDGGIDAVRRGLYRPMRADQLPDFVLPLNVVAQGYRVVYEPEALLCEQALSATADEYRMRVRVSLRAFWALFDMRRLLWGAGGIFFAWQLWSHKALRYLCFVFLALLLVTNAFLALESGFYKGLFFLQILGYAAATMSPLLERRQVTSGLLRLAHYFAVLNIASAHAFSKFLAGQKQVLWTPRKG